MTRRGLSDGARGIATVALAVITFRHRLRRRWGARGAILAAGVIAALTRNVLLSMLTGAAFAAVWRFSASLL